MGIVPFVHSSKKNIYKKGNMYKELSVLTFLSESLITENYVTLPLFDTHFEL